MEGITSPETMKSTAHAYDRYYSYVSGRNLVRNHLLGRPDEVRSYLTDLSINHRAIDKASRASLLLYHETQIIKALNDLQKHPGT